MNKRLYAGGFLKAREQCGDNAQTVIYRKGEDILIKNLDLLGGFVKLDVKNDKLIFEFNFRDGDIFSIGDAP